MLIALAQRLYKLRRSRDKYLAIASDLFADPAWDVLLDLFVSGGGGDKLLPITSACVGADVPQTTALRYIEKLVEAGFVERCAVRPGRRKVGIRLTSTGRAGVENCLLEFMRSLPAIGLHLSDLERP